MISLNKNIEADFLLVTGDAFVDHPSFGAAVIARVLSADGYSVNVISQPQWKGKNGIGEYPRPRLAALITSGNIDSMVAHYTAAKKQRSEDAYSADGKGGKRPDRAVIVYSNMVREAFPDLTIVIGGLEASLRRFAHYDYWDDAVRPSVLFDATADCIVYGMAERTILEVAQRLNVGKPLHGIRGTCSVAESYNVGENDIECPSYEAVTENKRDFLTAAIIQYEEHDAVRGKTIIQRHGDKILVCYPPAMPLTTAEMDRFGELPYTKEPFEKGMNVPAIEEVRFSLIHNRGCFGACRFCSLAFHQGRMISTRSHDSLVKEAEGIVQMPDFKGYIHDVGGPSANFRHNACTKQKKAGMCRGKSCLAPKPCVNLDTSHADYLALLRKLRVVKGVKKVFVRSGIRYDYMLQDEDPQFFKELVQHHISGQLKVAPEHCVGSVLKYMGKPDWDTFVKFSTMYAKENELAGKKQFLVPYLISSHPGCTLNDAVELAVTLKKMGRRPEQVQDFYPTPGTLATCMYYTELDVDSKKHIFVAKTPKDKSFQRALLQWDNPKNRPLVVAALREAKREDVLPLLLGIGRVRPVEAKSTNAKSAASKPNNFKGKPSANKNGSKPNDHSPKPQEQGKQTWISGKTQQGRKPTATRRSNPKRG